MFGLIYFDTRKKLMGFNSESVRCYYDGYNKARLKMASHDNIRFTCEVKTKRKHFII